MKKRIISFLLAFVLMVTDLPWAAMAAEAGQTENTEPQTTQTQAIPTVPEDSSGGDTVINATAGTEYYLNNGLELRVNTDGKTLTVIGFTDKTATSFVIPDSYKDMPIVSIDSWAFGSLTNLTSITIPDSVTSIGYYAFYNCTSLTDVNFGENSQLTTLDESAFYSCTALECITIPDCVISLGETAFKNCTNLKNVVFGKGSQLADIGRQAFYGCSSLTDFVIPAGVKAIGEEAFYGCSSLTSIAIPAGVTTIGKKAFYGCTNLAGISLPDGLQWIGESAFAETAYYHNAANWEEDFLYIGNHLIMALSNGRSTCTIRPGTVTIASAAFYRWENLTEITIPATVRVIGDSVFSSCQKLAEVTFEEGSQLTHIGYYTFGYCTAMESMIIPAGVISLGDKAFNNCSKLSSLTFADNSLLNTIGNSAFSGCRKLESITIPAGVVSIGQQAFYGCSGLTSLTFAANDQLLSIDTQAFYGCSGLTSLELPASLTTIGEEILSGCRNLQSLTVPFVGYYVEESYGERTYPFGYYFGTTSYTGGVATEQTCAIVYETHTFYIPETLQHVTVLGGELPWYAFENCSNLVSITLPESMTSVDDSTFLGCTSLTYNTYDNGLYLGSTENPYFLLMSTVSQDITSCTIYEDARLVCTNAFDTCTNLTSLVIPDSVIYIGFQALKDCDSLASITVPFVGHVRDGECVTDGQSNFKRIFGYTLEDGIYTYVTCDTPSTLKSVTVTGGSLPDCAFYGCGSLTSITLRDGVTAIGDEAFYSCGKLQNLSIPDSVESIGVDVLEYCNNLSYTTSGNGKYLGNSQNKYVVCVGLSSTTATYCTMNEGTKFVLAEAFSGCTSLTWVKIPSSVRYMGNDAFNGCSKLTEVRIADLAAWCEITFASGTANPLYYADNLYLNGELVTELVIPEGVTAISDYAFYGPSCFTSLVIPEGVTSIGDSAFYYCSGLTSVTIPASVTSIGADAFQYTSKLTEVQISDLAAWCAIAFASYNSNPLYYADSLYLNGELVTELVIPEGVTAIADYAFRDLPNLTCVTIASSVESIGNYAFYGCSGLRVLVIPAGVKTIGEEAFYGCSGLTDLSLSEGVESIGTLAFYGCKNLTSLTVPDSVETIGEGAFSGCSGLTSITIPFVGQSRKTATDPYQYPLGYIFGTYSYTGGTSTKQYYHGSSVSSTTSTTYYIPTSLRTVTVTGGDILYGAFYNCSKLTKINLPDDLTQLADYAFYNCIGLTEMAIPQGVTAIGKYAFYNCTGLKEIELPGMVVSIGDYAFQGCSGLTDMIVPDSVETIGASAFNGCSGLKSITIPFVGQSRKTATDTYQYPYGYIFGAASYTGGTATKQYYYAYNTSSTTSATYYIPTNLKTVTVTDGNLLYGAFYGCKYLTTISIGEGVESINPDAFIGCDGLEAFEVSDNNPNYCAVNRILYNKDRTEIIWTPASHTFLFQVNYIYANWEPVFDSVIQRKKAGDVYSAEIPEVLGYHTRITSISGTMPAEDLIIDVVYYENDRITYGDCNDAISWTLYSDGVLILRGSGPMPDYTSGTAPWAANSYDVQLVYMDARITSIGAYAFEGCKNMTFIDYGYSITHIGEYAFSGCAGLTSFQLPNSVTEIANGAFAGCAGLKNVVIPDNITAVGAEAFRGCSELIQVTVGGNVASIGENAFADCSRLTQVYFRGKPATLGSNAFGRTGGKYIYYYSNVDGWDAAIVDGLWYGYTAVPYNAIAKENFDGTNVYIIKVVDKHNMPLVGAVVELGGNVQATNADGMVYFIKPEQPQVLTVSCANHITFTDEAFAATTTQVMDIIELSDKPSTVQGVRLGNQSIATSVATLNCAESKTVTITVSGYSKYPIDRYELYQGNRLIATETTSANQCTFRVSAGDFEEGQTVLVRMYTAEGDLVTTVASALNIDVVKMASVSKNQVITELSDVNLDITLGEFGDVDFELPFSIHGAENIYVRTEGRTMIVGINLDVNELFDRKLSKKAIQEKIDDYVEDLSGGAKMSVEVKFCGYLEIEYLGNDQYYIKSSYVKMSIGVWAESELRASFYGVVGVYFKLKFGVEGTVEVLIDRFSPEKGFELDQLDFTLQVGVEVEGGVFLLWGAGSAGVFANLTMGFTIGFVPRTEIKSVFVQGDLGIRWQIGWGLLKGEYSIGPKDIYRWPESAAALMASLYAAKQDPNSYTPNDRGYLADRSQWLFGTGENGSLQENVYEHVTPQLITCGDTTIMVWLDDNSQRDNANFQMLYYSVYSGGSWSEPVAVDDNGTFDCEFDAYTDGEKIYVIYTEMKQKLSDAQTLDITDPESIAAFVTGVEVNVAVYENGRFSTPVRLTDNDICEQLPEITEVDGVITAAWLESNAIGVETETLGNTVVTAVLGVTGWSEPAQFVNGQNTVSGITAVHLQGSDYFAYIVDADGNGETQNDQLLVLRSIHGDALQLDTGAIANVAYTAIGETPVLTWYNNGQIYMIADAAQQPVALTPENVSAETDYQIVSLSDGRTLLLFVMKNYDKDGNAVDNTDIYSVYIDCSGCLSSPVRQTKTEGYITSYAVSWQQDKLLAVFTETFAQVGEEDGLETVTHFRSTELEFYTDIVIDSLKYDLSQARPGGELQLQFAVTNQGTDAVDGLILNFYDALGQLLYTLDCDMTLASGAAAEETMTIVLPQELSADAYTVEILPQMAEDAEPENNQVELNLAYADLSVSAEQKIIGEKNYILVSVINDGNTASKATLSVYAAEELIAQLETDVIDPGITQQYLVDVSALTSDEDKLLSCMVASEFADPYGLNNTDTVYLFHIQNETFTTGPDQVIRNPQLSCNVAEFDKYVPADITVEITAEAESFVGVEGLVLGVDYSFSNGVVTIYSAYLATLTEDTHTLNFVFDFGYETSVLRSLTISVSDSTPVVLTGSIAISGQVVVGGTVYADLSGLNVSSPNVLYAWSVDGQILGNQSSYVVRSEDLGKILTLTVTGTDGYTGTFTVETVVTLYQPAAPNAPVISKVESTCLTVVRTEGMEYSLDCITWQDSNVFADLQPNQTYTVYARIKATATSAASEASVGVSVTTPKITMTVPDAPQVESKDHCTVVLVTNPGMEYRIEGGEWTQDPVFTGLQPNTTYVFYQRYQETDTAYASEASALAVTTLKLTVAAPDAPQLESVSSDTVILAAIAGMEYKIEGGEWTQDPVFTGLQPNTTYVFYQRYQETDTAYASEASLGLQVTTPKTTVATPDAPQLESVSSDTVVLAAIAGMEYMIEGGEWTEDPVFTGLQPNTTYVFYQRYQETDTAYASEASTLTVTTLKLTVAAPDAPQLESKTRDTIVLVSSPDMEYRIEGGEWTEDPVFTGLQPNTTYVFYQRYRETDTAYASEPSTASFTTVGSFEISGTIASGYAANAEVTVKLMQGDVEVASTVTTTQTYSLTVIAQEGVYQLVVSKAGHVTAIYEIVVTGEDLVQDVTLSLYGDVNGDGWTDVEDAMMILQYEVGLLDDSDLYLTVGDVSGDGWVDVEDAMLILQYEVGLVEQFPAEEISATATALGFRPCVFAIPQILIP